MIAGQAEVHFDVIGGIHVAWCEHPFVHVVAQQARQGILEDLLSVLRQTKLSSRSAARIVSKVAMVNEYGAAERRRMRR